MTTQATKRLENYKLIGLTREGDRVVRGHYHLQLIAIAEARKNEAGDLATMVIDAHTNEIVHLHNAVANGGELLMAVKLVDPVTPTPPTPPSPGTSEAIVIVRAIIAALGRVDAELQRLLKDIT